MAQRYTLLFVDDERSILRSLKRLLHRENYEILLAQSGNEGLDLLSKHDVDLVVSDMRMPEMNGTTFLKLVHKLYPNTIRLILTGYAEREAVQRAFSEADVHELIPKPWDDDELKVILRESLPQTSDQEEQRQGLYSIIDKTEQLPTLPGTYLAVQKALEEASDSSIESVAKVIIQNPPIAARILQIANSAFFGQRREIETVSNAIFVLGLEMIRNLVLSISGIRLMRPANLPNLNLEAFWQHSLACGAISRYIARETGKKKESQETAMLAGTLHDMGKLVLAKYAEASYRTVLRVTIERQAHVVEIERELMGTDHPLIGGYLAEWWNLPSKIVEAVQYHYEPAMAKTAPQLTHQVHLADVLTHRLKIGSSGPGLPPDLAPSTTRALGISVTDIARFEKELQNGDYT